MLPEVWDNIDCNTQHRNAISTIAWLIHLAFFGMMLYIKSSSRQLSLIYWLMIALTILDRKGQVLLCLRKIAMLEKICKPTVATKMQQSMKKGPVDMPDVPREKGAAIIENLK